MNATRKEMEAELAELLPSSRAQAILLRRDDAGLARAIDRLRNDRDEVRRSGHIAAAGIDLRVVERV